MNDVIAIIVSALYVAVVLFFSAFLAKKRILSAESSRKLVHFLVSLWIFIMVYWMESLWARIIGPISFIFINAYLMRKRDFEEASGMIYFPITLLSVSLLYSYSIIDSSAALSSILVMGAGDSTAALVGMKIGKHGFFSKSLEGSAAMFLVSFIVLALFSSLSLPLALLAAAAAAFIEAMTPHGLDNLTVPFAVILMLEVL